ncbi:Anti-sigma regulatory factor (Ser/Thr protein kinase) [Streptomyces sp. WMMB 714]|uniref:ATP-binding protein n=1 Tax=Streptomyces sp. WMMB 714 TaxID=1286822 RepID=UPI0005F8904F|nr:ATP-binding protein [Streptomyces sp. WMMB 714]SCK26770.1 Anti-sigma regulatory factor (Ser/Thr protein kinase) [Streptomyces sp. WMMB 714]
MNDDIRPPLTRAGYFRRERRSVPAAREFAARALAEWCAGARTDDVLLCVSELAANAVLHGVPPGRGYRLSLLLEPAAGRLRVEVDDSGPGLSLVRERRAGDEDAGGRGLLLVSALADKWGVDARDPGKTVWCELELHRRPGPAGEGRVP